MSRMKEDMTSQKDDLSQIKTMIQMLINNKVQGNAVSIPPGTPNMPDYTSGWWA